MSPAVNPAILLDTCLKATLVLGAAALAARVLRQGSAATRHLVWSLGVLAVLLLPAVRSLAPRWEAPLLPEPAFATLAGPVSSIGSAPSAEAPLLAAPRARAEAPAVRPAIAPETPKAAGVPISLPPAATRLLPGSPASLALLAWAGGALVVLLPLLAGVFRVARLGRRSLPLDSPSWLALLHEITTAFGIERRVRLFAGEPGSMPMAWGVLRPAVLLPAEAEEWPAARRRAVLTHELAHVRRQDCLTQALAHCACALYWFHPLVWVAARRLRTEREVACDDLVLRGGASGPDYADHLLELARSFRAARHPVWATVAMARPSQLEGRLLSILDPNLPRRGPSRVGATATLATAAALVVALAGFHPWARPALAQTPVPEPPPAVEPGVVATSLGETAAEAAAEATARITTSAVAESVTPEAIAEAVEPETETPALPGPQAERVVAALTGALRDSDEEVRREAVGALGQIRAQSAAGPLAEALGDKDAEVRSQAAFALGQLRSSAATEALARAVRADTSAEVRSQAAFALGQIRAASAVGALVAALGDGEAEVRQQAVFALGQIRDRGAVDGLIGALKDANSEVRQQAAFALGQIRDGRSVAPLAAALGDSAAEVRQQAVFALGQIRAPEAAEPLTKALKDGDPEVRQQAAFALGQLRTREAVPGLLAALNDTSSEVRQQTAFALGQIRDGRAAEALTAALKDKDVDVRKQAAFALGQLAQ